MAKKDNGAISEVAKALSSGGRKFNAGMPCKDAVRDIIRDVRSLIFPEYFECFCGGESVEDSLASVYEAIKKEVSAAFSYSEKAMSAEEAKIRADDVCLDFIRSMPDIKQKLYKDVEAGYNGDPAAKSREDIIVSYPGLLAIFVYRIAHELYMKNVPLIPRMMTEYAHSRTGIDINAGAEIGEYFFIDHGTGVVIGETTKIGDRVKLYQGVTLGALSTRKGQELSGVKRHPTIENDVTVYANSTILGGDTVIGEGCIIGGSAFITKSVPPHTKVIVKNQELILKGPSGNIWEI